MKLIELNAKNVVPEMKKIIENQEECIVYGIPDKNYVFCGLTNIYNKEFCIKNDIGILGIPNEGGVIVLSAGDFEIGHFSLDIENKFNSDFANKLKDYLVNKNINAVFVGNDLIIDDIYKCASFSSRRYGNILYSAFHISMSVNLELIKQVCTKPMTKIPKGLSNYGITLNEIKQLFFDYINIK